MSELHDIAPLRFNWTAANALVAKLRSTATELDTQIGERKQIGAASRSARGRASSGRAPTPSSFDERLGTCTGDAQHFVTSMRQAANDREELARLADQEQQRRV